MKKLKRVLKKTGKIIVLTLLIVIGLVALLRLINFYKYRITAPTGIQESGFVNINDCDFYVQLRGEHKENPLIIFVHGGPGFPLSYLSAYYQSYLESDYTFLQYDQRQSGRTFYKNETTAKELDIETMLDDLHGIVMYGKQKLSKEKVIIIGQSWGSILGTLYSQKYPENVAAYIGVGQVTDFDQGKIVAASKALQLAKEKAETHNTALLAACIQSFERARTIDAVDLDSLVTMIATTGKYARCEGQMSPFQQMYAGITSPDMNLEDVKWFLKASNTTTIVDAQKPLINYMYYDFNSYDLETEYQVPTYFIQGICDYITPTEMVEAYYKTIKAPKKKFITIKNTGHTPFLDAPDEFAKAVRNVLTR